MDRVRSDFATLVKPDYDDPNDPLVSDVVGFFEKDPLQAATPMTVDHANMLTEELRNLVVALGGVPSTTDDTQLATLCEQGTFTPVFDPSITTVTIDLAVGRYLRVGRFVHAWFVIRYTNTDALEAGTVVKIVPPYEPEHAVFDGYWGSLSRAFSNIGTAGLTFPIEAVVASDFGGNIVFAETTASFLALGDNEQRTLVGRLEYETTGTFNY